MGSLLPGPCVSGDHVPEGPPTLDTHRETSRKGWIHVSRLFHSLWGVCLLGQRAGSNIQMVCLVYFDQASNLPQLIGLWLVSLMCTWSLAWGW